MVAGGDGSLINLLMRAVPSGVDVNKIVCCVLPFGTGNDFSRVSGWGHTLSESFYSSLETLVYEICTNSEEKPFNIWNISM